MKILLLFLFKNPFIYVNLFESTLVSNFIEPEYNGTADLFCLIFLSADEVLFTSLLLIFSGKNSIFFIKKLFLNKKKYYILYKNKLFGTIDGVWV